ncbi:MAG: hypothetical protein R3F61_19970 [Myxococcota bacterium]
MTATYQLIQVQLDPFSGRQFPLGALVRHDGGHRVARVHRLPSGHCLGHPGADRFLERLQQLLGSLVGPELPSSFGPYTFLTQPLPVPSGVKDPVKWVEALLNPATPAVEPGASRAQRRAAFGWAFFKTVGVDRLVKRGFCPTTDMGGWRDPRSAALEEISHWVPGNARVLLMEPIAPQRVKLTSDLKAVAGRFSMYRDVMEASPEVAGSLVAYVVAGGSPEQRSEALGTLQHWADEVIDTTHTAQRAHLVDTIRTYVTETEGDTLFQE